MFKKDFNTRKCIFCNNKFKKQDLVRFYIKDKIIYLSNQEQKYRGFYICNDKEHWNKLKNKKHRYLNINQFDEQLIEYLKNKD